MLEAPDDGNDGTLRIGDSQWFLVFTLQKMEENTIWQYSLIDTTSGLVEINNEGSNWRGIE